MSEIIKVEIRLLTDRGDPGEWQWLGKLDKSALKMLCDYADKLSEEVTGL